MVSVVTGAGGFIGGHLVAELLRRGEVVRAVDIKQFDDWYQLHPASENVVGDCSLLEVARAVTRSAEKVFNLSADMGGMGFIENNRALCMMTVLTSTHLLQAAKENGADRFFYASSACVYAADRQRDAHVTALKESDAYPAEPEDGYGWEKLFGERMARHYREDFGLKTRIARFHNVYGPIGTFDGGREKAPAALSRKVARAILSGDLGIEIWGDGEQTRSFTYIDDCVRGIIEIIDGDFHEPVNLGSSELVTINGMVDILEDIAGATFERRYDLTAPQGVRGRNSDNTLFRATYGWEPSTSLHTGLERTHAWILDQLQSQQRQRQR